MRCFFSEEARAQAYGYNCNRCLVCCHDKHIQVNPYEVAQLARGLGLPTTEVQRRFTQGELGVALAQVEEGACVFLGPEGCTVHPFRPLVCRLYPLGRTIVPGEKEEFIHLDPHPESRGVYHTKGTIAEFLEAQDTARYIQAADEYFLWLCEATECLAALEGEGEQAANSCALLDIDAALAEYCKTHGKVEPTDIEDRKALHIEILYLALERSEEQDSGA